MNAGRPRVGDALVEELVALSPDLTTEALEQQRLFNAVFWDGDQAAAERAAQRVAALDAPESVTAYALAMWRLWRGETDGVSTAIDRLRQPQSGVADQRYGQILEAYLAHVEGDPRADSLALALESALQRGFSPSGTLALVRIFEARGDLPRALAMTRRTVWNIGGDRYASTFLRDEGRLAAALGEREAAIRASTRYLAMRADPEPELIPEVERIRAELAALTGG